MEIATIAFLLSAPITVFQSPAEPYHTFRIPSLINTKAQTLLAIAEARQSQSDASNNTIVLRRSTDKGITWQAIETVAQPKGGSYNNPTIVETPNQTLILHFQHYPAGTHEYDIQPGHTGSKTVQTYQITSTDQGKSWSKPINFTAQIKHPDAHTLASGPGIGIVTTRGKHPGRIIIPYNQRVDKRWFVNMAISDNNGKSWRQGKPVPASPEYQPNEVQVVELASGEILLNARNQAPDKFRLTALSQDQGETFDSAHPNADLPDPTCQASILRFAWPKDNRPGIIAFANPANQNSRTQGTIKFSLDEGQSWVSSALLEKGSFQYSSMTMLTYDTLGILYEHVTNNQFQIRFRRLKIE